MIGNDIVDLNLTKTESNWKRKGFLDKIFTDNEQILIFESASPEIKVWDLWSRKEAAYKIYNRMTQIRTFNPKKIECFDVQFEVNETVGYVIFENNTFFSKTNLDSNYLNSVAFTNENQKYNTEIFDIKLYKSFLKEKKIIKNQFGIPYLSNQNTSKNSMISIAHHGKYCSYTSTV